MKEDAQEEVKPWFRRLSDALYRNAGVAVSVVVAAVLAVGWLMADTEGANPVATVIFTLFIGGFFALCVVRKWTACLAFTSFLLVVGLIAALQIILGPSFVGQFRVAYLTLVVYAALGIVIGAVFQLVSLVHRATHDVLSIKATPPKK